MEFILRPEIQGEIAQRNVVFPAVEDAELPADYDELAFEPSEPVTLGYEALSGSLEGWLEDWEREILG
jgi:thiamine transport system substrate-binding protein